METAQTLLILTNLPDENAAQGLAENLVTERLAACVTILPGCRSVYRWQGKVESANEVQLLIKTAAGRYDALEAAIRAQHPYELPEIIAVPLGRGLQGYLDWVATETLPADSDGSPSC